MKIRDWDSETSVLVVAEIGNNHEGDPGRARAMVEAAAECGAGAVKFQTLRADGLVSPADAERLAQLKRFELPFEVFEELAELAHRRGLIFISTPLYLEATAFLDGIVDALKIASGDNDFFPLIRAVAETDRPVILSTGMSGLREVERAVDAVVDVRRDRDPELALLHCVSAYPTPPEEASLRSIPFLAEQLQRPIGYSDHTLGLDAALAAVAMGACIVEKHFTLRPPPSSFRDHALSADPEELQELVERVDRVRGMLGAPGKAIQSSERANLEAARRSITAVRDMPAGQVLQVEDLIWLRPRRGAAPGAGDALVGRRLRNAVKAGDPLQPGDVE